MQQLGQYLAPQLAGQMPGWMGANADPGQFLLHNLLTPGTPYHEQLAQMVAQVEQGGANFEGALAQVASAAQNGSLGADAMSALGNIGTALKQPAQPQQPQPDPGRGPRSPGAVAYGPGTGQFTGSGQPFVHPTMKNVPAGITPPPGAAAYRLGANGQHEFRIRGPAGSVWVPYQAPATPTPTPDPSGGPPVVEAPEPGPVFQVPGNQTPPGGGMGPVQPGPSDTPPRTTRPHDGGGIFSPPNPTPTGDPNQKPKGGINNTPPIYLPPATGQKGGMTNTPPIYLPPTQFSSPLESPATGQKGGMTNTPPIVPLDQRMRPKGGAGKPFAPIPATPTRSSLPAPAGWKAR